MIGLSPNRRNGKLRFGRYPYTVTRVKVMQSFLIRPDDYMRMKKMGPAEIVHFLAEGQYKQEIDSLAGQYQGLELIELAFNENLAKTVNKLLRISLAPEVRHVIRVYANKWITENCKIAVRARFNRLSDAEVRYAVIPIAPTTYEAVETLIREPPAAAALRIASCTGADPRQLQKLFSAGDAAGIERLLDRSVYERLLAAERQMKLKRNDPLRAFLRTTVLMLDIKNILRLKAASASAATIRDHVLTERSPSRRKRHLLEQLLAARDVAACAAILRKSAYRDLVPGDVETNLPGLEDHTERFLLAQASALLHRRPLSVAPIFGYLLQKEIELRNLRLVLHARSLGLPDAFVERNMLVAK